MIAYASPDRWVSRSVHHDRNGRPEVVCEVDDITTVRLDLSQLLESGEDIADMSLKTTGIQGAITCVSPFVFVALQNPSLRHQSAIVVSVITTLGEQFELRFYARTTARHEELHRVAGNPYQHGGTSGSPPSPDVPPSTPSPIPDVIHEVWDQVDW